MAVNIRISKIKSGEQGPVLVGTIDQSVQIPCKESNLYWTPLNLLAQILH